MADATSSWDVPAMHPHIWLTAVKQANRNGLNDCLIREPSLTGRAVTVTVVVTEREAQ